MADKELQRVRSEFVSSVSKELISQLLDDILKDKVVNDGEKDSILEENNSRADKARHLLDTVKRKGDEASRKLIAHIKRRDPTLYSELGLSCEQPAVPASKPQEGEEEEAQEEEWSTSLIPATDGFWTSKENDADIYPVTKNSIRKRVALLITNIKFTRRRLNRHGAERDHENMKQLLQSLGYEVVWYKDLTGKEIDAAMIKFSKHPRLKETDSVVVVIMSHGKLGAVLGVNWSKNKPDLFPIDNIYKHLGSKNCPALLNKPKIIIIQACRGRKKGKVVVRDGASAAELCDDEEQSGSSLSDDDESGEENLEEDAARRVHREKDFTSLLSSTPHTVSYRHPVKGSTLIRFVVEVFNTYAHEKHIEELFRKVMQRFERSCVSQMPTKDRDTLTKNFYFFPGH